MNRIYCWWIILVAAIFVHRGKAIILKTLCWLFHIWSHEYLIKFSYLLFRDFAFIAFTGWRNPFIDNNLLCAIVNFHLCLWKKSRELILKDAYHMICLCFYIQMSNHMRGKFCQTQPEKLNVFKKARSSFLVQTKSKELLFTPYWCNVKLHSYLFFSQ